MQLQRSRPQKKRYPTGLRADGAKKILHADATIFRPLDHSKVYIYFLVDNYSRFILGWRASLQYASQITFEMIKEAYQEYDLGIIPPYIKLVTDGGSENKGAVDSFVNHPKSNIEKLIAQSDIIFSNSMVEAVNKRMKYDFLLNTIQVNKYLAWAVREYNNKPHSSLFGLTPAEVFGGMVPDKHLFQPAIKMAAQKRCKTNIEQGCMNCFD